MEGEGEEKKKTGIKPKKVQNEDREREPERMSGITSLIASKNFWIATK